MASLYRRGSIWYYAWYDDKGRRHYRSAGVRSKRAALRKLNELQEEVEDKSFTDGDLVNEWLDELECLGRSQVHLKHLKRAIGHLGTEVRFANQRLGLMERSDQTIKSYYRAAKQWGRWCYINGFREVDPMLGLRLPTRRTGRVYIRGVFTEEEAKILSEHHMLYRVSLATGLRLGELRKLDADNKRKIQGRCCLWLKPKVTKNRFEDIIPIAEDLWEDLELPMWVPSKGWAAKYLRRDLERLSIPVMDQDDHPRDWHSMRVTFCDLLIKKGVPIPTVARLMRHSDGGGLLLKRYAVGTSLDSKVFRIVDYGQQGD